jgi:hypothetical protein
MILNFHKIKVATWFFIIFRKVEPLYSWCYSLSSSPYFNAKYCPCRWILVISINFSVMEMWLRGLFLEYAWKICPAKQHALWISSNPLVISIRSQDMDRKRQEQEQHKVLETSHFDSQWKNQNVGNKFWNFFSNKLWKLVYLDFIPALAVFVRKTKTMRNY